MKRWTRDEVRLAKDTLMLTSGHKTKAAKILSEATGRTHAAIMYRLCRITNMYPTLRKKSIKKRMLKQTMMVSNHAPSIVKPASIQFHNDHIRIYF